MKVREMEMHEPGDLVSSATLVSPRRGHAEGAGGPTAEDLVLGAVDAALQSAEIVERCRVAAAELHIEPLSYGKVTHTIRRLAGLGALIKEGKGVYSPGDREAAKRPSGNGRTPAENQVYARIARQGVSRSSEVASAAKARAGRRARAAERIIARDGQLAPDVLEREIDREIAGQMNRARAAALTARRKDKQRIRRG